MSRVAEPAADEPYDAMRRMLRVDGIVRDLDLSTIPFGAIEGEALRFERCKARATQFTGGILSGSTWADCELIACSFASTDFSEAKFLKCRFADREKTRGSVFRFCDLHGARFEDCDLSLTKFEGCDGYDIAFVRSMLRGADFARTKFSRVFGRKVIKSSVSFEECPMQFANLEGLELSGAVLRSCDLSEANFSGARLNDARINGCDLFKADFERAFLTGADLQGSKLDGFDLGAPADFKGLMISMDQQHHLLRSLNVEVCA